MALDLALPGNAVLTDEVDQAADTYFLPLGPFADESLPTEKLDGRVVRQAWRVDGAGHSTLNLLQAVRDQLREQGYEILLDCAGPECGGFDFRFGIEVLPGPGMFVDLFDYRFLSARNANRPGAEYLSALISRAGGAGYVQLVAVGEAGRQDGQIGVSSTTPSSPEPASLTPSTAAEKPLSLIEALLRNGHVALSDLEFATGSSALSDGTYATLKSLASYLKGNSKRRVALVGHTDSTGSLEGNVRLSRNRAASVMERLLKQHGVSSDQIESNGMGYLSPIAPNTTEAGRDANRRVEAVLLSAE